MATFPLRENDIKVLAHTVIVGLTANPAVYPAPPVSPAALQALLDSFVSVSEQLIAARAAAEHLTVVKDGGLEELIDGIKANLRYAETTVNFDDAKLGLLGWAGKAAPTPMAAPGQPRELESPRQGEGWIFLDWKAPSDGGVVASYKIERRERPAGDWGVVGVAVESETTLTSQERGKDWEYRVIGINKEGEGMPSNTVAATL